MAVNPESRYEKGNPVIDFVKRVPNSVLLSFAAVGLAMILFGAVSTAFADPVVSGILGASGMVIVLINLLGYALYKYLEKRY